MKKIMFNDKYGLTKAVLEGRKTQTRRIIDIDEDKLIMFQTRYYNMTLDFLEGKDLIEAYFVNNPKKIPYKKGEIVAIAQSYKNAGYKCYAYRDTDEFLYFMKDGEDVAIPPIAETNKMYVKPIYMPHQIKITNVRIERLQDISDEDCLAEGVELNTRQYQCDGTKYYCVRGLGHWRMFGCYNYNSPREAYAALIDKVGKKGDWNRNPYVFVYDFELVK